MNEIQVLPYKSYQTYVTVANIISIKMQVHVQTGIVHLMKTGNSHN